MKRFGGGSATGDAITHSRWLSWCAVLFEISDTEEDVVWSKVGEARGLLAKLTDKTSNGLHAYFFVPGLQYPFTLASRGLEEPFF